jgi:transcriptional regulator with XRE-family HTH domain
MTNLRNLLAFNMKEQRHTLRISQAKLAEKIGTSTHYIGMIEIGKKFPSPEMLERIAEALEIDTPELFSTKGYPAKNASPGRKLAELVIKDIERIINHRMKGLEPESMAAEKTTEYGPKKEKP